MFRNYVQSMLNHRPFAFYEADKGGGTGDAGGTGTDPGADNPGDDNPGGDGSDDGNSGGADSGGNDDENHNKVTFTDDQQSFINQLINNTIKKERDKAEAERQKELERQKMSDEQKVQADLEAARQKAEQFKQKAVTYEIQDVARDMGVPANRLERFLKLVDREEIQVDEDGNVDRSAVQTVVKAVLGDFPEFKEVGNTKGPGGDFDRGSGNGAKYSMQQIKDRSPEEGKNNWDDVQKSIAINNKK